MVFFVNPLFKVISLTFLPVKVIQTPNSNSISFRISKVLAFYSALQCVLIAYSLFRLYFGTDEIFQTELIQITPTFILLAKGVLYTLHFSPMLIVSQVYKKVKLFKEISDISIFLDGSVYIYRKRFVSYLIIGYYSLCSTVLFICTLKEEHKGYYVFIVEYLKLTTIFAVVEFYEIVSDVKDCFYQLNKMLPEVFRRYSTREPDWSSVPRIEISSISQTTNFDLRELLELHRKLCWMVEKINRIYGCQNLAAVVLVFLQLIIIPLTILFSVGPFRTWTYQLQYLNWCFFYIVLLFTLVMPCSHTTDEAKRTVAIVSKLMERSLTETLFKEMDGFCRQLFLRKVEFSACGLFSLEIPLILSMLSFVTTYFTIILQFQMTDSERANLSTTQMSTVQIHFMENTTNISMG